MAMRPSGGSSDAEEGGRWESGSVLPGFVCLACSPDPDVPSFHDRLCVSALLVILVSNSPVYVLLIPMPLVLFLVLVQDHVNIHVHVRIHDRIHERISNPIQTPDGRPSALTVTWLKDSGRPFYDSIIYKQQPHPD